jgi:PAS domain S-box-containing protein
MLEDLRKQAQRQLSAAADPARWWVGPIALAIAVGITYFVSARLSLYLLTKPDGVAVFWPAAGVSSGVLIALGPRARLPVALGTIVATVVANLLGDRNIWSAIVFGLCNAGEALLSAEIVKAYFRSSFSLNRLTQVLGLLAAAILAAAVSGIGGTAGFKYLHGSTAPILTTWQHWFASDALGIVTVAPLIIGLVSAARDPPPRSELIEGAVALEGLILIGAILIFGPREPWTLVLPIALLFPMLLWLAARCRPVFASAAAFIVALTIVLATTFEIGGFGDPSLPITERILAAQAGILAVSLCALVLAALFAERRQHEAALMESESRLQEALSAGAVTAFEWDARTAASQRSENAAQILGYDAAQAFTARNFLEWINPDDRARLKAFVRGVRPDRPSYVTTFRFMRPDGREAWLEETARAEFDAAGRCVRIKGLTLDITERKQAEERQSLLIAELDHRVKNLLARVAAVATYTREGSRSIDQFVQALDRRIQSMATAHSLLSQSRWQGVDFGDLVRHQLAPYATDANMMIGGPQITLTSEATQAVAMVLHELVTNAAKYGALSSPGGQVSVTWDSQPNGSDAAATLTIDWRESGGPPITAPTKSGYGTSLIRDLIPHELGGAVDLEFPLGGVCCKLKILLQPT